MELTSQSNMESSNQSKMDYCKKCKSNTKQTMAKMSHPAMFAFTLALLVLCIPNGLCSSDGLSDHDYLTDQGQQFHLADYVGDSPSNSQTGNTMDYDATDETSGDGDGDLIPVLPVRPVKPKVRPQEEETEFTTRHDHDRGEATSFKPVEFTIEHQYPVTDGKKPEAQPGTRPTTTEDPEDLSVLLPDTKDTTEDNDETEESEEEREEIDDTKTDTEKQDETEVEEEPIEKVEETQVKSAPLPEKTRKTFGFGEDGQTDPALDTNYIASNGESNGNESTPELTYHGKAGHKTQKQVLSNIAKIGIAMCVVVLVWLILGPVICIVCRQRDKQKDKRGEEEKIKNGGPLPGDLMLTELGMEDHGKQNGGQNGGIVIKERLYANEAHNEDELHSLNQSNSSPSHESPRMYNGHIIPEGLVPPGKAPIAKIDSLDTEV